jgi:hypothetical protein
LLIRLDFEGRQQPIQAALKEGTGATQEVNLPWHLEFISSKHPLNSEFISPSAYHYRRVNLRCCVTLA